MNTPQPTVGGRVGHAALAAMACSLAALPLRADECKPTFYVPLDIATDPEPEQVVAADFDMDGNVDVAVLTGVFRSKHDNVTVYHGNGDGTFGRPEKFETPEDPRSVYVTYLDRDDRPDLFVVCSATGGFYTILNNGAVEFAAPVFNLLGGGIYWGGAGDFWKDGHTDLAILFNSDGGDRQNVALCRGDEFGVFTTDHRQHKCGYEPRDIAVADFNRDGQSDVAVANAWSMGAGVTVRLGRFDDFMEDAIQYPAGDAPERLITDDFNGDAVPDLAAMSYTTSTFENVSILLGKGDGTFAAPLPVPTYDTSGWIVSGNLNGDAYPDLVVSNSATRSDVSVFTGRGDGTFNAYSFVKSGGKRTRGVCVADFNNDGKPDIAVCNRDAASVSILLNTSDCPGFGCTAPTISAQPDPAAVYTGDSVTFSAGAAGSEPFAWRWRREGFPLTDDGRITGATTDSLSISPVLTADAGSFDVLVTNECGSVVSAAASLTVACKPDCNHDGRLNINDFICMQSEWKRRTSYGDYDGGGTWTINDFVKFQAGFVKGCP